MIQFNAHLHKLQPYVASRVEVNKIKMFSNENPLGMSPLAVDAIAKKLTTASSYPCNQSYDLKDALSEKLNVPKESLIIGNGSDEIFTLIAGVIINPGDEMVTARTTFSEYAFATMQFGGNPVFTDLENGKFSAKNLLRAITDKTKWVCIANPNNPTGTYLNNQEIEYLLQNINKNILVLLDEAYCEYATAADFPNGIALLENYPNLIITRTFSKIYGLAGLRVGYGIAHPEIILHMNKMRAPFNVNMIGQIGANAALQDLDFVKNSLENTHVGKELFYKELTNMGLKYFCTEGNFVLIHVPVHGNIVATKLSEMGILIRPTASFGLENAIRVSFGKPWENEKFFTSFKKVLATVTLM